jgi:hypothetical protein
VRRQFGSIEDFEKALFAVRDAALRIQAVADAVERTLPGFPAVSILRRCARDILEAYAGPLSRIRHTKSR